MFGKPIDLSKSRILVANDDGIESPGLHALRQIAEGIAGPEGEVWVAARRPV